jgi:hypothetical protein
MGIEQGIISLGRKLKGYNDAAYDLWTWLPSYRKAKKCLGDYACNIRPGHAEVMREACDFISDACDPSKERLESHYLYQCPCEGDCPKVAKED